MRSATCVIQACGVVGLTIYKPSQILTFSQSSSTRSLSAGELITTIVSRIAKAMRKSATGANVEGGL